MTVNNIHLEEDCLIRQHRSRKFSKLIDARLITMSSSGVDPDAHETPPSRLTISNRMDWSASVGLGFRTPQAG
ncbi:hypothetical protein MJO28_002043 [Puccinia striiformis f. sp. tritici]|uniref:Uncharacterized protein n=1 Tax=Puccinia striiformis f. sp. tritici TaxID=168172 RepID=A0ACC0EWX3_9BASI|nr:hypothetical protein MJO28_002043 [Puccinia striiformis f. sp. tritici]